ncbi:hypothetical protein PQE75_gp162 [Bacillus phage vB_BcoS-136]|uniref:Uncharacterized protein n=1 Tax=Bacillus phage vB_BcoS-136 TaxID=2419619 RepID=A0A3G3BVP0_9CAUD|nr:hypothetical protein PQE75_gp162 [Bacillus phage vB_BcoS-136]AYP68317.1 hypothetical protein vBBcoS136_00203 [Bacillus phage vB_BcoS-136]
MKIFKFQTRSCMPCKMVDMMLNEMGVEVDSKIYIEDNMDVTSKEGLIELTMENNSKANFNINESVMKSPTMMLVDDEHNEISRVIGIDEDGIQELFKKAGKI